MKNSGLLVMDVDSTLIKEEVIDLLGKEAGVGHEVATITERAMKGEIDFKSALIERVKLLRGLPITIFDSIYNNIHLNTGAKQLIDELHSRGYKVGVVSGGFDTIVKRLTKELDIDYAEANHLECVNGHLTGNINGSIVTKETKCQKLQEWAKESGISLKKTIAVGDGANDLPMIQTAGIGIAFCAKPIVKKQAPYCIDKPDLFEVISIIEQCSTKH